MGGWWERGESDVWQKMLLGMQGQDIFGERSHGREACVIAGNPLRWSNPVHVRAFEGCD